MLTDEKILKYSGSTAYQRGCSYYKHGNVGELTRVADSCYTARVMGSRYYKVKAHAEEINESHCDCPAYRQYSGICKHIVAVLKAVQAQEAKVKNVFSFASGEFMSMFQTERQNEASDSGQAAMIKIVPTFFFEMIFSRVMAYIEFTVGAKRQYVMKSPSRFAEAMASGSQLEYGKEFILDPQRAVFDPRSKALADLLVRAYEDEQGMYSTGYGTGSLSFNQKKFILSMSRLEAFFEIMKEEPFAAEIYCTERGSYGTALKEQNHGKKVVLHIVEDRPPIKLNLSESTQGGVLSIKGGPLIQLDSKYRYFLYNHQIIYKVDQEFSDVIKPILQCSKGKKWDKVELAGAEIPHFFSAALPILEKALPVKVDKGFWLKYDILPLEATVQFDDFQGALRAELRFGYGDISLNPLALPDVLHHEGKMIVRDINAEKDIFALFQRYQFIEQNGCYLQNDEEMIYEFLVYGVPKLHDYADVYYSDEFKGSETRRINNIKVGARIGGTGLLEVSLQHTDFTFAELIDVLASYRQKKRYHRLADGTFIPLESEELDSIADFVETVGWEKERNKDTIQLPVAKASYLDRLARESIGIKLDRSGDFKKMVREIADPSDLEVEAPAVLENILRDYQKTGFKWLSVLAKYGLGGILADDMGLGKTLQVIAFLLKEKEQQPISALIVTPTSLMYNWMDEIEKFAPSLRVMVVAGAQSERGAKLEDIGEFDIILTTYNLLKRDIERYEAIEFTHCFIDEAQHIKNPNTLNAKTVKQVKTRTYFALTGTPIENTLTELWSIFDFLMPGYLLSHQAFKKKFELPIIRDEDKKAAKELQRYIAPFVLRRLKSEVLKELPPKTESKVLNDMTAKQAKVYAGYFAQAQQEFAAEMERHGMERSHIKILAILTRLRQICCHPSLFLEDYGGGSGKLDALRDVVGDAVSGGHRLLIFSQFTGMLALIQEMLTEMGLEFFYLDGQTPALERLQMVKTFNQNATPVFLISLKAGGTGLNLTGADMVIHYDPWWNPAVEDQASDRAYRLGQQKHVQVMKFITKGTVEEKIFALQQKKKDLIDQMIQPGETFVSKLTEEELTALFT